ncbi:MAG TPA: hypothetical protein IAB00_03225 [Candidatus Avidehalobacter gallistercoris]|uniref:DUF4825 domain-containing protein n=1 Tax=Candidatus Avidehalobacter gallistercoris TaxID=2840694 RepID=A0A9D1KZ53_9FIRM|nr:hypothetical protein [Candidatus Avidehalobacter gallistercoris]
MAKKRRKLRQEVVLAFCTLLVIVCGVILVAPTYINDPQDNMQNNEIRQKMVNEDNIGELLDQKNINIGESTKIRSLLRDKLPAGLFLSTFDITLDKLTVKYALTERSEKTPEDYAAFWTEDNCQQIVMYNTAALFVLVRNLEIIEIDVEGYAYPSCIITRAEADALFEEALADIADAESWQSVLIDNGVYDDESREAFFAAHPLERTATAMPNSQN